MNYYIILVTLSVSFSGCVILIYDTLTNFILYTKTFHTFFAIDYSLILYETALGPIRNKNGWEPYTSILFYVYGGIIGIILTCILGNFISRKNHLIIGTLLITSSCFLLLFNITPSRYFHYILHLIGGIGTAILRVITPVYLSELATRSKRGIIISSFQVMKYLGRLFAFIIIIFLIHHDKQKYEMPEEDLRHQWDQDHNPRTFTSKTFSFPYTPSNYSKNFLKFFKIFPCCFFLLLIFFFIPNTPRYLFYSKHYNKGFKILYRLYTPKKLVTISEEDLPESFFQHIYYYRMKKGLRSGRRPKNCKIVPITDEEEQNLSIYNSSIYTYDTNSNDNINSNNNSTIKKTKKKYLSHNYCIADEEDQINDYIDQMEKGKEKMKKSEKKKMEIEMLKKENKTNMEKKENKTNIDKKENKINIDKKENKATTDKNENKSNMDKNKNKTTMDKNENKTTMDKNENKTNIYNKNENEKNMKNENENEDENKKETDKYIDKNKSKDKKNKDKNKNKNKEMEIEKRKKEYIKKHIKKKSRDSYKHEHNKIIRYKNDDSLDIIFNPNYYKYYENKLKEETETNVENNLDKKAILISHRVLTTNTFKKNNNNDDDDYNYNKIIQKINNNQRVYSKTKKYLVPKEDNSSSVIINMGNSLNINKRSSSSNQKQHHHHQRTINTVQIKEPEINNDKGITIKIKNDDDNSNSNNSNKNIKNKNDKNDDKNDKNDKNDSNNVTLYSQKTKKETEINTKKNTTGNNNSKKNIINTTDTTNNKSSLKKTINKNLNMKVTSSESIDYNQFINFDFEPIVTQHILEINDEIERNKNIPFFKFYWNQLKFRFGLIILMNITQQFLQFFIFLSYFNLLSEPILSNYLHILYFILTELLLFIPINIFLSNMNRRFILHLGLALIIIAYSFLIFLMYRFKNFYVYFAAVSIIIYNCSWGIIPMIYQSEILPTRARVFGSSLGSLISQCCNLFFFLIVSYSYKYRVLIFCFVIVFIILFTIYSIFFMKDTTNLEIEQMDDVFNQFISPKKITKKLRKRITNVKNINPIKKVSFAIVNHNSDNNKNKQKEIQKGLPI
ncbi:MFS general substrate transporter [Anaeromyces robustus]|uniref:MFS general substrate transporter n=1 Tax=Anaeromyces robustus TaxID=1754192 RepID=A0A1Y1XNH3_9FUNG|nr:MFS general substrate transporter [Anaeromyces robustus]|eukprot:ORX87282.1 MFS general substrate transporter [Anaeromyces robustus]